MTRLICACTILESIFLCAPSKSPSLMLSFISLLERRRIEMVTWRVWHCRLQIEPLTREAISRRGQNRVSYVSPFFYLPFVAYQPESPKSPVQCSRRGQSRFEWSGRQPRQAGIAGGPLMGAAICTSLLQLRVAAACGLQLNLRHPQPAAAAYSVASTSAQTSRPRVL